MVTTVRATEDPAKVLEDARRFLEHDPVRHNLILTLLHARVASPEPGRYWVVEVDGVVAGVAFQSPLTFMATITPMQFEAVHAIVDAIADQGVVLPGVSGVAGTVARFAGQWTERTKSGASPVEGQRIYEVEAVIPAPPTPGHLRPADRADRDVLVEWFGAFQQETGGGLGDIEPTVDRRLRAGQLWIWEDTDVVSLAGVTDPVSGVARIGPVYTPPNRRSRGYGSALVSSVSLAVRVQGHRCILYTDLANPTSSSIYRSRG